MSYDIHGDDGTFVAGGPSIGGLSDLKKELNTVRSPVYPNVQQFLEYGYSKNPLRLGHEFSALAKHVASESVKKTCMELGKACRQCKEIVILHNHNAD